MIKGSFRNIARERKPRTQEKAIYSGSGHHSLTLLNSTWGSKDTISVSFSMQGETPTSHVNCKNERKKKD